MTKAVVAAIRTKPERVLQDVPRLMELGGLRETLDVSARTILKDNISWHLHFPAANTTPWQLEGTILGLLKINKSLGEKGIRTLGTNKICTTD